jgi:hypothetical protein
LAQVLPESVLSTSPQSVATKIVRLPGVPVPMAILWALRAPLPQVVVLARIQVTPASLLTYVSAVFVLETLSYSPVATTRPGSLVANLTSSEWVRGKPSTWDQWAPASVVCQTPPNSVAARTRDGFTGFLEKASTRPPNRGAVPAFVAAFALMSCTADGAVNAAAGSDVVATNAPTRKGANAAAATANVRVARRCALARPCRRRSRMIVPLYVTRSPFLPCAKLVLFRSTLNLWLRNVNHCLQPIFKLIVAAPASAHTQTQHVTTGRRALLGESRHAAVSNNNIINNTINNTNNTNNGALFRTQGCSR